LVGRVVRMEDMRNAYKILVMKSKVKKSLGRITLRYVLEIGMKVWTRVSCSGYGPVAAPCEWSNKSIRSVFGSSCLVC